MSGPPRVETYRDREFARSTELAYDVGMSGYHLSDNMTIDFESKPEIVVNSLADNTSLPGGNGNPHPNGGLPKKMGRPARSAADRALMKQVGRRLLWAREALELTQEQISGMVGLDHSTWCYYEQGKRFPDPLKLPAICARLNVDSDYLMHGSLDGVERNLAIVLAAYHPELVGIDRTAPDKPRKRRP
jgi:transcriptional regulator with XRE-family HTH domain